jgi:hypothetical protein
VGFSWFAWVDPALRAAAARKSGGGKEARVREEVRIGKRNETEKQTVSETVRHEDAEIEKEGDSRLDPRHGPPRTERYQPKERGRS